MKYYYSKEQAIKIPIIIPYTYITAKWLGG